MHIFLKSFFLNKQLQLIFFEKANTSDLDTTDLGTTAQTGLRYIMRNRNITYGIRVHQGIQYYGTTTYTGLRYIRKNST